MTHGRVKVAAAMLAILVLLAWTIPAGAWIDTDSGPGLGEEPRGFGPGGGDGDTDPDDFPIVNGDPRFADPIVNESHGGFLPALRAVMAVTFDLLK